MAQQNFGHTLLFFRYFVPAHRLYFGMGGHPHFAMVIG